MDSFIYKFHKKINNWKSTLMVLDGNRAYKQEEILDMVEKMAIYLDSLGIGNGKRVVIISENKPHFLFILFALFYLKAIPVSVDFYHDDNTISALVKKENFIISDRKIKNYNKKFLLFSELMDKINNVQNKDKFRKIIEKNKFDQAKAHDPFIILCSSGTTELPKKVILSEANIVWANDEYSRLYNFSHNESIAFIVPTHYSLGILACGIIPFFNKKTIFIYDGRDIKNTLKYLSLFKINILPATPTIYNLINKVDLKDYDFCGLKLCDSGGQILPIAIINKFALSTGVVITEGYGLTETSSLTHFLVPDSEKKLRLGSMGKPCKKVKCKIIDSEGQNVGSLVPGELMVKGPQNMIGYDDKTKNKEVFTNDGWFKTGDIVYKDIDNFYYLVSRRIDLQGCEFKKAEKIRHAEEILYSLDVVQEATVLITKVGKLIVFVVPIKSVVNEKILKIVYDSLSPVESEMEIKLVNFIPRTSTHKVKRVTLR